MSDKGDLKKDWGDPVSSDEWYWIMANRKRIMGVWVWGVTLGSIGGACVGYLIWA